MQRGVQKDRSRQNWSSVNKSSISPNNEPANRNKTGLICGHVLHLEEYTTHAFEWEYFPGPDRIAAALNRVMEAT